MRHDCFEKHSNVLFRAVQNDKLNSFRQKFHRLYVSRAPRFIRSTEQGQSSIFKYLRLKLARRSIVKSADDQNQERDQFFTAIHR